MEKLHKGVGFEALQVRLKADLTPAPLNGGLAFTCRYLVPAVS